MEHEYNDVQRLVTRNKARLKFYTCMFCEPTFVMKINIHIINTRLPFIHVGTVPDLTAQSVFPISSTWLKPICKYIKDSHLHTFHKVILMEIRSTKSPLKVVITLRQFIYVLKSVRTMLYFSLIHVYLFVQSSGQNVGKSLWNEV